MNIRTALYVLALAIIGLLVIANWSTLARPVELNLLVARLEAPLVLLVLMSVGTVLLIDLIVHASSRRSWKRERRELTDDIGRLRTRADEADDARFASFRETLEREIAGIHQRLDALMDARGTPERPPSVQPPEALQ